MTDRSSAGSDGEAIPEDHSMHQWRSLAGVDAEHILERCPVGTVVVDSTGTIVYANERAAATLELTQDGLTGRAYDHTEWDVYYDDGTPIPHDEHPITRVIETGESEFEFIYRLSRSDGTERWLSSNLAPLLGEDGEVEYVTVTFEDVTSLKRHEERLTSEHVRMVEFRADRSAVPPSLRTVEDGQTRMDVESVVPLPDGTSVQYMTTEDLPASEFVDAIEEVPHFVEARLLSTIEGRTRIEAHAESATASEVFPSLGGRPRAIVVRHDEVRFLGELPGDVDPRRAADGIRQFHTDVELVSQELVYSPHLLYDIVTDALTDRQFGAIEAAYYGGYFESPRASTGNELADRFGVTRQTFNQHLRKAEQVVFQHLFEKSGAETD